MPTSHSSQINEIVELIVSSKPKSILDIGVGFGKYGFLSREYLELWDGRERYGDWKIKIDGIEAFPGYLTPIHDYIYDNIFTGNALEVIPTLKSNYDLVLLIDVIEHLNYEDGIKLLSLCLKSGASIIISTPKDIGDQKDSFGNKFETHEFQWKKKHFRSLEQSLFVSSEQSIICLLGKGVKTAKRNMFMSRLKVKVKRYFPAAKHIYRYFKRK